MYRLLVFSCCFIPQREIRKSKRRYYKGCLERFGASGFSLRHVKSIGMDVLAKREELERKSTEISVLALGSSHAETDFDPSVFDGEAFNFGVPSSDLYSSRKIGERCSEILPKLKHVFLFFSVFSPGLCLSMTTGGWRAVIYSALLGYDLPMTGRERWLEGKESRVKRVVKVCGNLRLSDCHRSRFEYGFSKREEIRTPDADDRALKHLRENQRTPDQMSQLDVFLRSQKERGIRVTVVLPPMRSDYRAMLPSSAVLFRKLFDRENVEVVNFYDDRSFSDFDFCDPDHLNARGARKLSQKLKSVLNGKDKKE